MATRGTMIHPRMMKEVSKFGRFPQTCEIQQYDNEANRTPTGGISYTWTTVPGLEAIPCLIQNSMPREPRSSEYIEQSHIFRIGLLGVWSIIKPEHRVLADDGRIFDIIGVEIDSAHSWTVLVCRIENPVAEPGV